MLFSRISFLIRLFFRFFTHFDCTSPKESVKTNLNSEHNNMLIKEEVQIFHYMYELHFTVFLNE